MKGPVVIRSATLADAARLAELLAAGALSAREDPSDPGPYADALAEIERTPGASVLVAEVDGEVVGMCQLVVFRHLQQRGGRCAEVESVHVHPQWRSRGVGTLLMAEAVELARAADCYRVQLTSNLARPDAHRFYRRLGFEASHVGFKLLLAGEADPGSGP